VRASPGARRTGRPRLTDPARGRHLQERGFHVVGEGRLSLVAQSLLAHGKVEPLPGAAVGPPEVEEHDVRVELDQDVVRDVEALLRRFTLPAGQAA
jgi:hypothetical protein